MLRGSQIPEAARQPYLADARRYLQLADRHASELGPPVLLVVYGLSGTEQKTLAQWLAAQLNIESLGTDARHSPSDATVDIYQRQRTDHEPDHPDLPVCNVDTDDGIAAATNIAFGTLRPLLGLP